MYQVDATARAPKGLTLNNLAQARKCAVWGHATRVLDCVPEARALIPSVFEEFKSASLRDAVAHILAYPTLRFERGCSLRSLPHACAGLLRGSASGTISSHHLVLDATARAPEGLTLNNPSQVRKGAVWGHATRVHGCVPEARALNPSVFEEFESASLRDAVAHILAYPTLRFKRGCSLRSLPHACAVLLRGSASGTISSHHLVLDATARAPEGLTLNNPSQARKGAVWGHATRVHGCVQKARALNPSVFEEVFLSYDKPTLFQQGTVLLFKADSSMVFLLSLDIVHYPVLVVYTIGESCILVRPSTEMREGRISFKPLARKGLHRLHILSDRDGGRQGYKNMHMVGHTANAVNLPMQVVGLLHDDRIELAVVLDGDSLLTPKCTEHYMIERLDITHVRITKDRGEYCDGFESASLRDAVVHILAYPTLRFERGCSLRSLPHACAGLLRVSALGTTGTLHLVLPTPRFERGCSHWPLLHAYAGLLRVSASGTSCQKRTNPRKSSLTHGQTRCCIKNTVWTRTKLHLLRA